MVDTDYFINFFSYVTLDETEVAFALSVYKQYIQRGFVTKKQEAVLDSMQALDNNDYDDDIPF